ncbi:hypothetical protein [Shewanella canadensis]|nr:hypothetical protein [Shewanella canadensis]
MSAVTEFKRPGTAVLNDSIICLRPNQIKYPIFNIQNIWIL